MMRDEVTKEVITKITNNIADTLLIGINENKEEKKNEYTNIHNYLN